MNQVNQSQSLEYEDQIRRYKSELKSLEDERREQNTKFSLLQRQYSEMEYQVNKINIMERENSEMKSNMANYQELKRRVSEY